MAQIADVLESIQNSDVFFHLESDFVDWTRDEPVNLIIQANNKKSIIEFNNAKEIESFAASFGFYVKNSRVLSWNLKNIFSFFKKKSSIKIDLSKVYDLSILCSYFSLPKNKPTTCKEAFGLFNIISKTNSWKNFSKFYDLVYDPLIRDVIPDIETNPLVDIDKKKFVYCYYEIEGQSNGRMKTLKALRDSYLPHSMGEDEKSKLKLPKDDHYFLCFDYKHMEVSVLEWASKDEKLAEILLSDQDLYKSIWQLLTGQEASEEQRKICKSIFLPVIFGQKAYSLSQRLKISEKNASKLIYKLERAFPVAFTWVNTQVSDSNNFATDLFGRRRKFQVDEFYKIKNFCIQSPANMICLRKLVKLHEALGKKAKMCFHIHDGYCVSCDKKDLKNIFEIGRKTLEEDEDLFPNLKLKTSCYFGENLNNLRNIREVIK